MLFRVAAPLLFVGAVAAQLAEGTYRITNAQSQSSVRVFKAGDQLSVSSSRENPGPFELWDLKEAQDGGYTINNVGLNVIRMLDTFAAVRDPVNGEPVVTDRNPTVFNIEDAGDAEYVVKIPHHDLLWNVEPPVIPRGTVNLRHADGSDTERWIFTAVQWPPA